MTQALRIGVAGLGTVGGGTLALLEAHGDLIAERCGRPVLVSAVSARDRRKDRGLDLSADGERLMAALIETDDTVRGAPVTG